MATLNVGAMAARLGLDPSDFLDKMKGVQGFNGFASAEMARQWKKTGRDGQEGLRLIDEALGIHVARPVARIVSETFPALGKALGGILPGVAFSALGIAIFEFAEGLSRRIDEAKKKQDEYTESVRNTRTVFADASSGNERDIDKLEAKIAGLRGDKTAEANFKIKEGVSKEVEELAKQVDALAKASEREGKAATEANAPFTRFLAIVGEGLHILGTTAPTREVEEINKHVKEFEQHYADLASQSDPFKAKAESAAYLADETERAKTNMAAQIALFTDQQAKGYSAKSLIDDPFATPVTQEKLNALYQYQEFLRRMHVLEGQSDTKATDTKSAEDLEARKKYTDEVKAEIQALTRLGDTSRAAAASAVLMAESTGKGTAETIRATAAAEAEKKILDQRASVKPELRDNQAIVRLLAENAVTERRTALIEQTAKAEEEFNRKLGEEHTHDAERLSALDAEASSAGKVAAEQAKVLAGLTPIREELQNLKDLYASLPAADKLVPTIGPPANQGQAYAQQLRRSIGAGESGLQAETANKTDVVLPRIQAAAFAAESHKIDDEILSLAHNGGSAFESIDSQVKKATHDLEDLGHKVPAEEVEKLRQKFVALQNTKIGNEFSKLAEQLKEAQIEATALGSGSPFAKLDAEAQKLGHEFHMSADEITRARQELIQLQAVQNATKAFERVDALNPAGAKMQELTQQLADLRAMQVQWEAIGRDVTPIKLAIRDIVEEEDKMLLKTGGIGAGIRAWVDDLQRVKSEGEFTFDLLTQATKGFEDNAVKSFLDILETERGGHAKLIKELRSMWAGYFNSLAEMALKHQLDRLLAPITAKIATKIPGLGGALGGKDANTTALTANTQAVTALTAALGGGAPGSVTGTGSGTAAATAGPLASIPVIGGILGSRTAGGTAGGLGGGGVAGALTGLTTAVSSNTTALGANTAALNKLSSSMSSSAGGDGGGDGGGLGSLDSSSSSGGDSGGGDGDGGGDVGGDIGANAAGTNDWSGGPTWVGEQGPEILNLSRGSQITPNSEATRGGGDTHNHYDMRGAIVADDVMRKADAARMMAATKRQAVGEAVNHVSEIARRTPRGY